MTTTTMKVSLTGHLYQAPQDVFSLPEGSYMIQTNYYQSIICVKQVREIRETEDKDNPLEVVLTPNLDEFVGKYVEIEGTLLLQTLDNGSIAMNGSIFGSVSIYINNIKSIPLPESEYVDYDYSDEEKEIAD